MDLWRRSALVRFGVNNKDEITLDTETIFREGEAIPQITFDINKSIIDKNKAKVSIYNLDENSRSIIDDADSVEDIYLEVYAGYAGENTLIFTGDVQQAENYWDGTDHITSFEAYDGLKAGKKKYIKSHAPKTDYVEIIKDALKGLGDTIKGVVIDVKKEVSQNGTTLSGVTDTVMKKLVAAMPTQNLEYTIQDGIAYVKPANKMINENSIPIIAEKTGMIGSPKRTKKGIEFEALIQDGLLPSSGVELNTRNETYNGIFIIQKSRISGETRGSKWSAVCTAIKDDSFEVL